MSKKIIRGRQAQWKFQENTDWRIFFSLERPLSGSGIRIQLSKGEVELVRNWLWPISSTVYEIFDGRKRVPLNESGASTTVQAYLRLDVHPDKKNTPVKISHSPSALLTPSVSSSPSAIYTIPPPPQSAAQLPVQTAAQPSATPSHQQAPTSASPLPLPSPSPSQSLANSEPLIMPSVAPMELTDLSKVITQMKEPSESPSALPSPSISVAPTATSP